MLDHPTPQVIDDGSEDGQETKLDVDFYKWRSGWESIHINGEMIESGNDLDAQDVLGALDDAGVADVETVREATGLTG